MYGEPAMNTAEWNVFLSPWPAEKADDFYHPGFDYTRFRVEHWQRFERMLTYARERDMIVSVILDIGDGKIHLAPGSEDERRYIRYATARLTAFSNITWDLGDDLDTFRDDKWAHETGTLLEGWDPYRHLATHASGAPRAPGPRLGVVRFHLDAGLVAQPARAHAGGAAAADQDRPHHSAGQRGIWLRGPLSAVGAAAAGRFGRNAAADRLGHRDGRRLRHGRRNGAARRGHLAGHRGRLDERAQRRHHDDAGWLRAHGGLPDELRMVEDGTAR